MSAYLDFDDALQVIDAYGFHIGDVGLLAAALARSAPAMLWINGYRHDFGTDDGFDLVLGVATDTIGLAEAADSFTSHPVTRRWRIAHRPAHRT